MSNDLLHMPGTHIARANIPAETDADLAWAKSIFRAPKGCTVTAVYWIPDAAVSGAATNNFAFAVRDEGTDGSGTGAVTTTKTYDNGVDSVGNVPEAYTLSTDVAIAEGAVVSLVRSANGTGLASPSGVVEVHYQIG